MAKTLHQELAQRIAKFNTLRETLEDNIEQRAEAIERSKALLSSVRKFKDAAHKAANKDKLKGIKSELLVDAMIKLSDFEAEITDKLISAIKRQKSDKIELKRVTQLLKEAERNVDEMLNLDATSSSPAPTPGPQRNKHSVPIPDRRVKHES